MAARDTREITPKMFKEMKDDFLVREMKQDDIADKFNIKKTRLKYLFKLAGVKRRDKNKPYKHIEKTSEEVKSLVIKAYEKEKVAEKIAIKLNISRDAVLRILRKEKIRERKLKNKWTVKNKKLYIIFYRDNGVEATIEKYKITKEYANELYYRFRDQFGWNPKL